MDKNVHKIYKYSIRKFKIGVGSAIVGLGLVFAGTEAFANEVQVAPKQEVAVVEKQVATSKPAPVSVAQPVQKVVQTSSKTVTTPITVSGEISKAKVEAPVSTQNKMELVSQTPQTQVAPKVTETEVNKEAKVEAKNETLPKVRKKELAPVVQSTPTSASVEIKASSRTTFRNTGTNNQVQNDVYKAVEDDLRAVELNTSPAIANQLAPARISAIDVVNKRLEISKATGKKILDVTPEEAEAAIKAESIGKLNLDEGFAAAKNDLENLVKKAVGDAVRLNPQLSSQTLINKVRDNKEAFLLGAAYINKYYDLQFGTTNTKDILKTNPSFYGGREKQSALDFLISIGRQNYQELSITNTVNTYNKVFLNKVSNKTSVPEFLEYNNRISNPTQSIQDWFVKETNAYISEVKSQEPNKQNSAYRIYDVLKNNAHLNYNLLPLLAVSENSIYALSNTAGVTIGIVDAYVNKKADVVTQERQLNEFKASLDKANTTQQNFIDFWYRVAKPETHAKLEEPTMTIDTLLKKTDEIGGDPRNRWSSQTGTNAAIGVREFIAPMGLYANYVQAGGEASGNSVRLFLTRALETNGLTTYAHELTHIYEDKVWMAQDVRDGLLAEFYARGLYEPYQYFEEPYFNINSIFEIDNANGLYNQSPRRFENADDLKEYMSGTFDVLYTLDLLEAESILAKSDSDKKWWFNKIQMVDTKYKEAGYTHKANEVVALDSATAAKLKSIDDLIDNDIIAERTPLKGYNRIGKFENNDYYSVPMFSSNYAALENDKGVSGDYQTRRMAYELLAQYGYYEGMVPYISNQYKNDATAAGQVLSDKFILGKIFNGEFADAKDFKKEMFEIRKNKLDKLKPITITYKNATHTIDSVEKLRELFKDAVESDLATKPSVDRAFAYDVRNVELLKEAIYKAYSLQTGEFRESIYREPLADTNEPNVAPVKASWINGYVAPAEELVKNAVTIDNKLVKSKEVVAAESSQSEVTVLVTYTDGSTDKVKVPVSIDPVTKQEVVAKSTRFERNDNLDFGQRETVLGKDGSFENVFTYVLENGRFVERVSKQNEVAAIDDVIKVGTKPTIKVEETPYKVDKVEAKDLKIGVETVQTKGQNEIVHYVTTYVVNSQTGEVLPTITRNLVQERIDEVVRVGILQTAKGTSITNDELPQLQFDGKPVFEKGSSINQEEKPKLDLPKVETEKGESLKQEALKEITIELAKGTSINQEEKSKLELIKVVTSKGESLKQEALEEITIELAKGTSINQEEKPKLELPKVVTAKGESVTQDALIEIPIANSKGQGLVQEEKPRLNLTRVEFMKGSSLIQEEKPRVELERTSFARKEKGIASLKRIKKLENSLIRKDSKNVLPKTTSAGNENNFNLPIILSGVVFAAGIVQLRRRKND